MQLSHHHVLRVAIKRPFYKLLDYNCKITPIPSIGSRVSVPLGNISVTAIVVETDIKSELDNLKEVIEVIDEKPLLSKSMMTLLTWASQYYFYPLGEVLFHALPVSLRKSRKTPKASLWKASSIITETVLDTLKRAPKQHAMLKRLLLSECDAVQLQSEFGKSWRNIIRQLEEKNFLSVREVDEVDIHSQALINIEKNTENIEEKNIEENSEKKRVNLTEDQAFCIGEINSLFNKEKTKPVLLHGITGSGKTEVYLRVIEPILDLAKQVLVLVPEIGLTPQLLSRFEEHFPQYNVAVIHSSLADGERMKAWLGAKSGSIDIVIGTRSAVFTPMKNLGAILIDEEHDGSFKQQEGFLYQGRDMALKRAYDERIPILLGSATPSLETLHNVKRGRFHYLRLSSRPGTSIRPEMVLQDIRALPLEAGISSLMMDEVRQHLNNNNQVMLFLNRRGFSPVLMCPSCGWYAHCKQCDIGMTYHASSSKTICHHCGLEEHVNNTCPDCKSNHLTTQGQGTERIEEVLKTYFPETPVIRVDRDSTSRKGSLEKILERVHKGVPVILIGTQMLSKGHDFPNLTLVGILDVDQALFSMDYRAQERLTQQILQVAGRAGRGEKKGRVVLQTSQPTHPVLLNLLSQGYYKTAEQMLSERNVWNYPPYGAQAMIRANSETVDAASSFLEKLRGRLELGDKIECDLLGPIPSPLSKRAGRYRFQLLLSSKQRGILHAALGDALLILSSMRKTGGVRWHIDVDPMDFL